MTETLLFTIEQQEARQRIDKYLGTKLASIASRSQIKKIIEGNHVLLNGKSVKPHHAIREKDVVSITIPDPVLAANVIPSAIPLSIIYEDDHVLVIDKPAGMVVHPAAGHHQDTLVNALVYYSQHLSDVNGPLKPGIVHRLDKDTSGALVVAKNNAAHRHLSQQFTQHTIRRIYGAIVYGVIKHDEGTIDAPIARNPFDRKKMSVRHSSSRYSQTMYRVIERGRTMSVLEIYPRTGRTHQIRVHLAHIGYPVVGDAWYGRGEQHIHINRQALHAKLLGFIHPVSKEYREFEAPFPEDMGKLFRVIASGAL